ncbi:MFS transporter [Streptomyces sp. NRRL F-2747]|uniref:MFS transporter n=1 Tax=Streptomyces sp. NRRL F-2747 TaxID=1463843 RepID=UPI0004CA248F|nr:MFS transporter [Streptomyces sp. NRRL F-2747]
MKKRIYAAGLSDAVGLGMYLSLSVLFFHKAVDLPNTEIGLVLGIAGITSLLGAMPIARAAERFGTRTVLTVLFLVRAAAFLALALSSSFIAALLASAVAGVLSRGISPLIESGLIARASNEEAVGALARLRSLRNAGMAAGALPSGAAIAIDEAWAYRAVMVLSAVLFIGCAAVCRTFGDGGRPAGAAQGGPSRGSVLRDRAFLRITALYGALTMSALILGLGVPLWVVQQTQAPAWTVTLVQVLNTAVVVLLQVRISKGSEDFRTARRMMRRGGLLSALAAGIVPLTTLGGAGTNLALVVAAALLFSLGELYIVSGTTGAALLHIPEGRKTGYLAAFNLGFAVTTVVGPPLITTSVGLGGWAWLGWAVYFTVAGLVAMRIPRPAPAAGKAPQTAGAAA